MALRRYSLAPTSEAAVTVVCAHLVGAHRYVVPLLCCDATLIVLCAVSCRHKRRRKTWAEEGKIAEVTEKEEEKEEEEEEWGRGRERELT